MSAAAIFARNRGFRIGWRLFSWLVIVLGVQVVLALAISVTPIQLNAIKSHFLDPRWLIVGSAALLAAVVVATLIAGRAEHLSLRDYYIPTRTFFGRFFWQGLLWGFLAVSLLIALIAALHGYHVAGFAVHGRALAYSALWWLLAAFALGLAEEVAFRSYLLRTLADGIHFWPAAVLISIGFGALYFKPYGNWQVCLGAALFALFGCLTIRRTGSLAFIIGFHAAFDWALTFFYSGRDAGKFAAGHLLQTSWTGPAWLTGGAFGPEASWAMGLVLILLFLLFARLYRPPSQLPNM
ncbi:MAG TPA: CPBP family intramembrane glutamic endopeptidase [Candidatus Aquilonibacter sp.]|nr:CPBP family intramembrane glutamic endopeptidase [Candidatus Aquilonibacter sp.]